MRYAHTVETVRRAEGELMAGLADGALMQRAATGLARVCARALPRVYGSRVVLLIGSGDNGGDALFTGSQLARRGAAVCALLVGSRVHEGGLAALRAAGGRAVEVPRSAEIPAESAAATALAAADLVVDGLVGIGGTGGLRGPHAALAALAGTAEAPIVAVDLPSGIDADTGAVDGTAVRADITVAFGTYKPGLLVDPGAEHAGVVEFVDIGLAGELPTARLEAPQAVDIDALLPRPRPESTKYRRGVLGMAVGSDHYRGAAVLAAGGALRGGVGMVRYAGGHAVATEVLRRWPEVVATVLDADPPGAGLPERVDAWVVGPGRGVDPAADAELEAILAAPVPVLLDADAITLLGTRPQLVRDRSAPTLLTPHAGELARLLADTGAGPAEIEARRLEHATRTADEYGCVVLLKGSTTVIAEPGRPALVDPMGTPLLATAGTGDVLSGLVGSLLCGGLAPREAAMCGTYLHGLAARLAHDGGPISASDLVDALPSAIRALRAR